MKAHDNIVCQIINKKENNKMSEKTDKMLEEIDSLTVVELQ